MASELVEDALQLVGEDVASETMEGLWSRVWGGHGM